MIVVEGVCVKHYTMPVHIVAVKLFWKTRSRPLELMELPTTDDEVMFGAPLLGRGGWAESCWS